MPVGDHNLCDAYSIVRGCVFKFIVSFGIPIRFPQILRLAYYIAIMWLCDFRNWYLFGILNKQFNFCICENDNFKLFVHIICFQASEWTEIWFAMRYVQPNDYIYSNRYRQSAIFQCILNKTVLMLWYALTSGCNSFIKSRAVTTRLLLRYIGLGVRTMITQKVY